MVFAFPRNQSILCKDLFALLGTLALNKNTQSCQTTTLVGEVGANSFARSDILYIAYTHMHSDMYTYSCIYIYIYVSHMYMQPWIHIK